MNPSQPEPVAGEHNPDGLTPEQYGAPEWRLLRKDEKVSRGDQFKDDEGWFDASWRKEPNECTYRRRVTVTPQTGEQTPESAEVKACPECAGEPCDRHEHPIIQALDEQRAEDLAELSSSLASLQQENEKYKDCFNEMRDEAVRLRDERDQLRAKVERLTKEHEKSDEAVAKMLTDQADTIIELRGQVQIQSGFRAAWQDRAEKAEAQLAEREEDRWQPIETAPKDGKTALLFHRLRGRITGAWDEDARCWSVSGRAIADGDPQLTHWQPLPKPPAIRSARGATPEGTPQEGAAG